MSPPPVTPLIDWLAAALGPSEPMKASSSSPGPAVVRAGAEIVEPAELWRVVTVLSSARVGAAEVVTVSGAEGALTLPAAS